MLDGAKALGKSVMSAEQHFEKAAGHFMNYMETSNPAEYDAAVNEMNLSGADVTNFSMAGAKAEMKRHMLLLTDDAGKVESWIENHWYDVVKKGESLRRSQIAAKVAKWVHIAKVAFVSSVVGFIGIAFGVQKYENHLHGDGETAINNTITYYDNMQKFQASVSEYDSMMNGLSLDIPSVPDAALPEVAPEAQVQAPEVALPPAVAAIAQQPIQIQVMNPQGAVVQTATRTVQQVYTASPVSRPIIQQRAECCSGGGGGGHPISGWTVTSPFGLCLLDSDMLLRAIIYAMLHPFTGAYHIADFYHFSMAATGVAMNIARFADAVLIFLVLVILERKLVQVAEK